MKKPILLLLLTIFLIARAENAHADWRRYVWTYEYMSMPKGTFELEYYLTHQQPEFSETKPSTQKHYLELEYGITDHWDIALYQRLINHHRNVNPSFEYDGFKIRTRYRIAEKNKLPLDTLLYLEYIRDDEWEKPNVLEAKVILAKDFGKFNLAYNQIFKQELESDGLNEHEYSAGVSYALFPRLKVAVESKGNYTDDKHYLGPTVSWAPGRFWIACGVGFGLNDKSNDFQTRFIVGIPF